MDTLKTLIYELFLENFYGKMIKQLIFLMDFYISHETHVKTLLKLFINNCSKSIR